MELEITSDSQDLLDRTELVTTMPEIPPIPTGLHLLFPCTGAVTGCDDDLGNKNQRCP
jgi:hypothetical protein